MQRVCGAAGSAAIQRIRDSAARFRVFTSVGKRSTGVLFVVLVVSYPFLDSESQYPAAESQICCTPHLQTRITWPAISPSRAQFPKRSQIQPDNPPGTEARNPDRATRRKTEARNPDLRASEPRAMLQRKARPGRVARRERLREIAKRYVLSQSGHPTRPFRSKR